MNSRIFFDCETGALPESYLLETFKPTFEPNKTLKDPAKIEADLATKKAQWLAESALHAERGEVLAIGWKFSGNSVNIDESEGDEKDLLESFVGLLQSYSHTYCGFNCLSFDLPFIRRRCLINGIPFPHYDRSNKWQPWTFKTYDAMADWQCGDRREYISLVTLAKALGIDAKDDCVGPRFGEIYRTDKPRALKHLENDVLWTEAVCERMLA